VVPAQSLHEAECAAPAAAVRAMEGEAAEGFVVVLVPLRHGHVDVRRRRLRVADAERDAGADRVQLAEPAVAHQLHGAM